MKNNSTLFILENPYISELMLKTLEKNSYTVLENTFSAENSGKFNLNIVKEKDINLNDYKIYSNSENSVSLVINNGQNADISKYINICKDKAEMRKALKNVYPAFFFKEVLFEDLEKISVSDLPEKFIIKPAVGFLSMGVHKVNNHYEWENTVKLIKEEVLNFEKNFPASVLNSSKFIIEEIIEGKEYAVDAYFDNRGNAVIVNIFMHPFVSEDDVSDRIYLSSKEIIEENLKPFEKTLSATGEKLGFKNFPVHIELIKQNNGNIIPVEINPMRFAGWCTTDLAYYAYGINIYEYFAENKKPDWDSLLKGKDGKIYYFAMAETPSDTDKTKIKFSYDKLEKNFSKILDYRKIDFVNKPIFAVIFGETSSKDEINKILELDMKDFISEK